MAEYKKYGRPSGSRPQRSFGNQNSQSRELYDAECNKCHQRCQVPFRPNGKKPVYCSNCFVKDDSDSSFGGDERKSFKSRAQSSNFGPSIPDAQVHELRKQVETMNATMEKLITSVETLSRALALTNEVRKHMPVSEAVVEKAQPKRTAKAVKKTPKKK